METTNTIRILIADDHLPVRMGLETLVKLYPHWQVVGAAADGQEAIEIARLEKPELMLMDLRMPKIDGVQATIAILNELPNTKIIVLTTFDEEEEIYRALQAGAHAYLLKGFRKEEFEDAVDMVMSGQRYLPTTIASKLANRMCRPALTQRETEILQLIARGRSNREIASQLFIREETVKTHMRTLFQKLGVNDRTLAVIVGIKHGLVKLQ
jgi:two-component system NarL family response regulator